MRRVADAAADLGPEIAAAAHRQVADPDSRRFRVVPREAR